MKMKTITKIAIAMTGLGTTISAYNYHIFNKVSKKFQTNSGGNYRSRQGNISYTKSGIGEPLLLIHGISIGASKAEWANNISALSNKFTVYTLDLLGFGDSDRADITYTPYMYVQIINDFIEQVIKRPTHIISNGISASFSVSSYTFAPDNVISLTLINPDGVGSTLEQPTNGDSKTKTCLDAPLIGTSVYNMLTSRNSIYRLLSEDLFYDTSLVTDKMIEDYYNNAHKFGANNKYVLSSLLSNYLNVDLLHFLPDINVPIFIIWSKDNARNPLSNLNKIHKAKPSIKANIFVNSKALPHYEHPKAFNNLIIKNLS